MRVCVFVCREAGGLRLDREGLEEPGQGFSNCFMDRHDLPLYNGFRGRGAPGSLWPHQDFVLISLPLPPSPSVQRPNIASFPLPGEGHFLAVCCMSELIHEKGKGNHYSGGSSRSDKIRRSERDFPDGPVVRALRSHHQGPGSIQEKKKKMEQESQHSAQDGPRDGKGQQNHPHHVAPL